MGRINIWIVLLLVSVLANGVLIGAGARTWLSPKTEVSERTEPRRGGFQLRAFVDALPEDQRRAARAQAEEGRREIRALIFEAAEARREAAQLLLAEPFDPDAAMEALDRARQARQEIERATERRILQIAAELSPEDRRAAFTAAMTLPDRRGPRGPDGRGPGGRGPEGRGLEGRDLGPDRRPPPPPGG